MTALEVLGDLQLQDAGPSLAWTFDEGTAANPGAGKVRLNHATVASATGLEISETSKAAIAASNFLALLTPGSTLVMRKTRGDNSQVAIFTAGATTDNGTHRSIVLTHVFSNGTFTDEGEVLLTILKTTFEKSTIAGYSAVATQTLKHISGTLTWVTDA